MLITLGRGGSSCQLAICFSTLSKLFSLPFRSLKRRRRFAFLPNVMAPTRVPLSEIWNLLTRCLVKFFMRLKLPLLSSMTSPRSMSQAVGRQKRSKRNKRISCVTFLKRGQGVGARKNRRREGFRRRERRGREVELLKGWEMEEIEGKNATILNISQSKKGEGEQTKRKRGRSGDARYGRRKVWIPPPS